MEAIPQWVGAVILWSADSLQVGVTLGYPSGLADPLDSDVASVTDALTTADTTAISTTLSMYRSRFEALPSIGSSIFAEHTVKRSNNATDNGHIYARGFVNDCYGLSCAL